MSKFIRVKDKLINKELINSVALESWGTYKNPKFGISIDTNDWKSVYELGSLEEAVATLNDIQKELG